VTIVQGIGHPQNRAQLAHDLLLIRGELAEGQVLLARMRFAVFYLVICYLI
jgi:hypothetical protein